MVILKKTKWFSVVGVSVAGGVSHNIAQIIVASFVVGNLNLFWYLPVLLVSGVIAGFLMGTLATEVLNRIQLKKGQNGKGQENMIAYIKGEVAWIEEERIVLESGNIGYNIMMPASSFDTQDLVGKEVKIYTHLNVREDAMQLYGFLNLDELKTFRLLLGDEWNRSESSNWDLLGPYDR